MTGNFLYCGDNLAIMRENVADESVALAYLDPPFKSNKSYGAKKSDDAAGFDDTWKWDERAEREFESASAVKELATPMSAFMALLGKSDMTAYLSMMAPRLTETRRALKKGGAVCLHCDPTSSHYLKALADAVFGRKNFVNEIVWHYRRWTNSQRAFQKMHDVILVYRKGSGGAFNPPLARPTASQAAAVARGWNVNKVRDKKGRVLQLLVYDRDKFDEAVAAGRLDPSKYDRVVFRDTLDSAMSDTWTDIQYLHSQARERTGWPTQKPEALLERIISTMTDPGDLVLDPFCGSGSTLVAAHKLGRKWIGIDKSSEAVRLSAERLRRDFGDGARWEGVEA